LPFPTVNFKIEPSVSIRDKVYNHLKQQILKSQIPNDAILVEARLAEQIGISRTPIREALHFLEKEGLLETIPRVGYRVRKVDWDEVEEIVEIRRVVETLAAKWASYRIKPEKVEALEQNLSDAESIIQSGQLDLFPELDARFHEILAGASGSKRLMDLIHALRSDMLRYRMKSLHRVDTAAIALSGHRRIFKSLIDKDEAGIEAAVRDHLQQAMTYIGLYAFGCDGPKEASES
jgi:DNA-binding GntR family transcriptional regulator